MTEFTSWNKFDYLTDVPVCHEFIKCQDEEILEQLVLLKEIALLAHQGGWLGMSEAEAMIAIRKLTIPYMNKDLTEEDVKGV